MKILLILVGAACLVLFLPMLLIVIFGSYFGTKTGCIGDTIGGCSAPFIGLGSIYLLYKTLQEQQKFNREQQNANEAQLQLIRDEQFKSIFFSLLHDQRELLDSLHASCVILVPSMTETKSCKISGQNFFAMAKYELHLLFDAMDMPQYQNKYNKEEANALMEQTYYYLYKGENLPLELQAENEDYVNGAKEILRQQFVIDKYNITEHEFRRYKTMIIDDRIEFVYSKFFVRYENCGCYFRHLYRILKFIDSQKKADLNNRNVSSNLVETKYDQYVQFLQAQMSNNEMLTTYYNCFLFPKARNLMTEYKLLENLSIESLIREEHARYASDFGMKHRAVYRCVN